MSIKGAVLCIQKILAKAPKLISEMSEYTVEESPFMVFWVQVLKGPL